MIQCDVRVLYVHAVDLDDMVNDVAWSSTVFTESEYFGDV